MRKRDVYMSPCSGVERAPDPRRTPTPVCDECLSDNDCTDQPGGICRNLGDDTCFGPRHLTCNYPSAACGGKVCPEPDYPQPP